jgi:branched-chain amino acid transport system permease protein
VDGTPAETTPDALEEELGTADPEAVAARDKAWTEGLLAVRASAVGNPWVRALRWVVLAAVVVILAVMARNIATHGLAYFLQTIVYGLGGGSLYALIALGYTMVYGIIELINFAHADVVTFGGFISLTLVTAFGFKEGVVNGALVMVALVLITAGTMLICGLLNITIERVAYRPLRNAPRVSPLITAAGMSFVLEGLMFLWKGPVNNHYPDLIPAGSVTLLGATVRIKDAMVVLLAILLVVGLDTFVNASKLGKAMRATAQDRDAASLMGIDINRTIAATFFIGAVLAGAGGMIFGLYFNNVTFDTGFNAGLIAFTAAVFGGIGNIPGAALGGLIIGIIAAFSDGYFSTTWTQVVIFAILILVLVFRPTGLLGTRIPEK